LAGRWLAVVMMALLVGCGTFGRREGEEPVTPARVTDGLHAGDPARRASLRLVVQGLDADSQGRRGRAQGSYEQAIKVDPTNPYAYLALARHRTEGPDAADAMPLLDQAAALFEAEGKRNQSVGVHLIGLRGRVLQAQSQDRDAHLYLDRAGQLAPSVWGDGYLSAEELR
jgi:uncharacterized membrane-anchored protein